MKSFLLITAALIFNLSANAVDHWDFCSSANGYTKMENGTLTIQGIGEIPEQNFSIATLATFPTESEECTLRVAGSKVIAYENTITVKEVTYTSKDSQDESKAVLICEIGSSSIPSKDQCL